MKKAWWKREHFRSHCVLCGARREGWREPWRISVYCSLDCRRVSDRIRGRCHGLVARLIRLGALDLPQTLKCVDCGAQAKNYDHRNYAHPLDVVPVCHGCNLRRGPGLYTLSSRLHLQMGADA